ACLPPPVAVLLLARTIDIEAYLDLWLTRNPDIAAGRGDDLRFAGRRQPKRLTQINLDHQDRAIHTHRYILSTHRHLPFPCYHSRNNQTDTPQQDSNQRTEPHPPQA